MKRLIAIIALFLLAFSGFAAAQDEQSTPQAKEDETVQQKPAPPVEEVQEEAAEEEPPPSRQEDAKPPAIKEKSGAAAEETFDEGLFEDALEEEAAEKREEEAVSGPRKITIDAVVVVKYSFANPAESFSVKYHINLGGEAKQDADLIKGNAKIATDISGFLAKSPAFECLLKVSIADVPYEIMFKKVSDSEADLNVAFKGQILEDWESLCTFLDASESKFNTRGSPEVWIGLALEKAKPSLSKLSAPLTSGKPSSVTFTVPKTTLEDSLGTTEYEGKGVVTIQPVRQPPPKKDGAPGAALPAPELREALARSHGS